VGILGVILFSLATITHSYQLFRYRTWYFTPMIVGTAMEIVSYVFRTFSSQKDPYNVIYFVVQCFFIVVAPVFFSATIYTILSIMINSVGRQYAPLPPKVILWIFITCDVVATVVQVAGAALVGSAESDRKDPTTPNNILLAGLAFQVFSFAEFALCLAIFLFRARKVSTASMMQFSVAVCVASFFIYLRTCFRLAETAQGLMESLSTHEVFFGCLEFAPVVVVAVFILVIWHPGKWLRGRGQGMGAEH
jgi:hypothetical protein